MVVERPNHEKMEFRAFLLLRAYEGEKGKMNSGQGRKGSSWGPKFFAAALAMILLFFWWLLIYSHGIDRTVS